MTNRGRRLMGSAVLAFAATLLLIAIFDTHTMSDFVYDALAAAIFAALGGFMIGTTIGRRK